MLLVVTGASHVDVLFDTIVRVGRIEEPGKGFAYVQPVQRVAGYMDGTRLPTNGKGSALQRAVTRAAIPRRPKATGRKRRSRTR